MGDDYVDLTDVQNNDTNTTNCSNTYCLSDSDYMEFIEDYIFPSPFEWLLIAMSIVIFLVGTIGNVLVIISVIRNPSMRSVTNHFIVNLSLADFLVLIICLPPTILWDVTETWFLGSTMCRAVLFCQRVCVSVSVLTFFCIAVDRWWAIVNPLKFASTAFRAKIAVLCTWLVAILFSLPELVHLDVKKSFLPMQSIYFTQCVAHWNDTQETAYQLFVFYTFYVVPFCTMTVLYGQIVYTLWWRVLPQNGCSVNNPSSARSGISTPRLQARIPVPAASNGGYHTPPSAHNATFVDNQIQSRRKVAMMLIITVALFAFCYLPVHTLNILRSTAGLPNTPIWVTVSLLVHWTCYMQNSTNPVIYYLMSEKFRREFNRIFKCCVRPVHHIRRRNSSEVFHCRPPAPTYYHALPMQRNSQIPSRDPANVIVQI